MKTQDNKSIFIELDNEGWKFTCDNLKLILIMVFISVRKIHIQKIKIFLFLE